MVLVVLPGEYEGVWCSATTLRQLWTASIHVGVL